MVNRSIAVYKTKAGLALKVAGMILMMAESAHLQPPPQEMRIAADYARFRGDEKNTYVEIYYAIPQRSLTYVGDSAGHEAGAVVTFTVRKGDSLVAADRWLVPHVARPSDFSETSMSLVGMTSVFVHAGTYDVKLVAQDRNALERIDSVTFQLATTPFETDRLALSDIEVASSITRGSKEGQFVKNTLEVVPNVEGIFNEDQECFIYAEAYNLLAGEDRSDFLVRIDALDAVGRNVISRERPRRRAAESTVLVDQLSVSGLPTGTYTLVISLLDSSKQVVASSGRKFYVYNQRLGIDSTLLTLRGGASMSVFSSMSEGEIDQEFEWARYEAGEAERRQYAELKGVDAKRGFLHDFWGRRGLGVREEYLRRVSYTNNTFQVMGRKGYRTDRGRVYITYGPPDDIERYPSSSDARPYEIWSYNQIQGGVIFVYVQRQPGGDHELVHSTHRSELRDDNWRRFVQAAN